MTDHIWEMVCPPHLTQTDRCVTWSVKIYQILLIWVRNWLGQLNSVWLNLEPAWLDCWTLNMADLTHLLRSVPRIQGDLSSKERRLNIFHHQQRWDRPGPSPNDFSNQQLTQKHTVMPRHTISMFNEFGKNYYFLFAASNWNAIKQRLNMFWPSGPASQYYSC